MRFRRALSEKFRNKLTVAALVLGVGVVAAVGVGAYDYKQRPNQSEFPFPERNQIKVWIDLASFTTVFPALMTTIWNNDYLLRVAAQVMANWQNADLPMSWSFMGPWTGATGITTADDVCLGGMAVAAGTAGATDCLASGDFLIVAVPSQPACGTCDRTVGEIDADVTQKKRIVRVYAQSCPMAAAACPGAPTNFTWVARASRNDGLDAAAVPTAGPNTDSLNRPHDLLSIVQHEAGHGVGNRHSCARNGEVDAADPALTIDVCDSTVVPQTGSDLDRTQVMTGDNRSVLPSTDVLDPRRFGPRWEEMETLFSSSITAAYLRYPWSGVAGVPTWKNKIKGCVLGPSLALTCSNEINPASFGFAQEPDVAVVYRTSLKSREQALAAFLTSRDRQIRVARVGNATDGIINNSFIQAALDNSVVAVDPAAPSAPPLPMHGPGIAASTRGRAFLAYASAEQPTGSGGTTSEQHGHVYYLTTKDRGATWSAPNATTHTYSSTSPAVASFQFRARQEDNFLLATTNWDGMLRVRSFVYTTKGTSQVFERNALDLEGECGATMQAIHGVDIACHDDPTVACLLTYADAFDQDYRVRVFWLTNFAAGAGGEITGFNCREITTAFLGQPAASGLPVTGLPPAAWRVRAVGGVEDDRGRRLWGLLYAGRAYEDPATTTQSDAERYLRYGERDPSGDALWNAVIFRDEGVSPRLTQRAIADPPRGGFALEFFGNALSAVNPDYNPLGVVAVFLP